MVTKVKSKRRALQVKETSPVYTANLEVINNSASQVLDYFSQIEFDESWTFEGCTTKDTKYITHGYHRYPAKFIPQLASRLINELTSCGDLVVDPFMGSGTTLVEAKVLGRPSVGIDINPVAHLISKAKTTPIEPKTLDRQWKILQSKINVGETDTNLFLQFKSETRSPSVPNHNRIDYWFNPETKKALGIIYATIKEATEGPIQDFFLCGFSHILKNCSIWLMKSNKPTRDFNKDIPDPYQIFNRHICQMLKKNIEFWNLLQKKGTINCSAKPYQGDARKIPVENDSVALVVTSPPYVTSYEYADLHQLTALWLEYTKDLSAFRKSFIGSAHNESENIVIGSMLGENTVQALNNSKTGKANEVAVYFSEMRESFLEMYRYLREGGKACIVIGDTAFKKVNVPNAEVFVEQMINSGFDIYNIIKRKIPSKILPQTRDPITGKFTSSSNNNRILAYPHEYIIIMEKV
jgi:DNA modification methylase